MSQITYYGIFGRERDDDNGGYTIYITMADNGKDPIAFCICTECAPNKKKYISFLP